MTDKNKITISEETQINVPPPRDFIPIDKRDWRRIKKMIKGIDGPSHYWENAGWFSSSVIITSFISGIGFKGKPKIAFFTVSAASLIITIILFLCGNKLSEASTNSKAKVVEEMEDIEKSVKPLSSTSSTSSLEVIEATYGSGASSVNVTDALNQLIDRGRLSFQVSNSIAGTDPQPGTVKDLKIIYKTDQRTLEKIYRESDFVNLP
jgi:hypothetical protein